MFKAWIRLEWRAFELQAVWARVHITWTHLVCLMGCCRGLAHTITPHLHPEHPASTHTHTHTCTGHLSIWSVWLHALLWLTELFRDQPTEKSSNCHNFISCDQSTNKHSRGPPRLERPIVMFLTATSQGRGRTDICFFSTSGTPEEYGISDEGNTEGERAPTSQSARLASF